MDSSKLKELQENWLIYEKDSSKLIESWEHLNFTK